MADNGDKTPSDETEFNVKQQRPKKQVKRQRKATIEADDDDFAKLIEQYKKKKPTVCLDFIDTKQKMLETMGEQMQSRCEERESEEKSSSAKLADQMEEYITQLQQKLVNDTRKKSLDTLKKSLAQAMQDF